MSNQKEGRIKIFLVAQVVVIDVVVVTVILVGVVMTVNVGTLSAFVMII